MTNEKIAVIIDSCTDVPKNFIEKYNMFVIPITINYSDRSYLDGIDITSEEIYKRLKAEVPKTSLPSGDIISATFDRVINEGYKRAIAVTVSGGLSGTNNIIKLISKQYEQLDTFVLDTKNIGIGAGISAISAGELIDKGYSFDEIKEKLLHLVKNTRVYFCVETLEYLKKGGRIGLVSCALGTLLELKPIISCNDDGVYYTVSKCVGRKKSIHKAIDLAYKFAENFNGYKLAIANGHALEDAKNMRDRVKKEFKNIRLFLESTVSPALGVHTGPGLIGIAVQKMPE